MRWPLSHRKAVVDRTLLTRIVSRNVALAARLSAPERSRLEDLTALLIESKRWESTGDLELDEEILVTIAANAAIPILALDPWLYRQVHWIVVHPTTTISHGHRSGPIAGVFNDDAAAVVGQAAPLTGPVSISWDAALAESLNPTTGRNVVIHEFAHKIDMSDGYSDGLPPVRGEALERWSQILAEQYEPGGTDPAAEVLRSYAWSSPAEFFAVSSEAFFCTPARLHQAVPDLYAALSDFYQQGGSDE